MPIFWTRPEKSTQRVYEFENSSKRITRILTYLILMLLTLVTIAISCMKKVIQNILCEMPKFIFTIFMFQCFELFSSWKKHNNLRYTKAFKYMVRIEPPEYSRLFESDLGKLNYFIMYLYIYSYL